MGDLLPRCGVAHVVYFLNESNDHQKPETRPGRRGIGGVGMQQGWRARLLMALRVEVAMLVHEVMTTNLYQPVS